MEYIEIMEQEYKELSERIDKARVFLSNEMVDKKLTTEFDRQLLAIQLQHMINYKIILDKRIQIAKSKSDNICSFDPTYDGAVKDCFK